MLKEELVDVLKTYLMNWKSLRDFSDWLASIDWNSPIDMDTRRLLGQLELLTTEVMEGMRAEEEFRKAVTDIIAANMPIQPSVVPIFVVSPTTAPIVTGSTSIVTWPTSPVSASGRPVGA